jgi:N-methylhydantoinase B
MGVISVTMLHEQLFAIGGAERQLDFDPTAGLFTCANHPAAVSGGILIQAAFVKALLSVFARMLACDADLKQDGLGPESDSAVPMASGIDANGRGFGIPLSDAAAGGSGARAYKDGVDSGGMPIAMMIKMNNVEMLEQFYPIYHLYRRRLTDSGGAGKWRGGTGVVSAITPGRGVQLSISTFSGGALISTHGAPGVSGGYPSPTSRYLVMSETDLLECYREGRVPVDSSDLQSARSELLRSKSVGTRMVEGDVLEVNYSGGAGYGDPLDREPELVARDVELGAVSLDVARTIYGVELSSLCQVDTDATAKRRHEMLASRLSWKPVVDVGLPLAGELRATGEHPQVVHEYVISRDQGDNRVLACARCNTVLSQYKDSYKSGLLVNESALECLPLVIDPATFLDEPMVLRQYCCPTCGVLMSSEVVRPSEPDLVDMLLY